MPTIRQRRVSANPPTQTLYPDDDRIYTEEDYAIHDVSDMQAAPAPIEEDHYQDDAFLPDDDESPWDNLDEAPLPAGAGDEEYSRLFEGVFDQGEDEDDLLEDDLLTDEELAELKRSRWQLISGLGDFVGIILGTAAILVLVTLLVSLINWLVNDMNQSFILLQKHF